jgi:DNA repair exonuclease SbcCD ATPase subunit
LSLVNARSALSRELEQLHRELDSQKKASKELSDFKGRADERERLAREQLDAARGEAESLKVQLVKKDVELAKTVSEFESLKAGLERGFVQMAAERDAQVRSATQGLDAARAELAHRTDELTKDAQRLATELKLAQRRVEELEALAGEQALQVSEQSAKLEAANQQAEASAEAFRSKLLQLMAQVQELTTGVVSHPESEAELHSVGDESAPVTAVVGASRRDGEERPDEAAAKPVLDKLWKEILQTHRERERSLLDAADQERRVVQQLRRQIRELAARVQTLQRFAQDVAPAGVTAPVLDDKELATLASVPPDALERKRQQDEQLIRSLQQQLDQQKQLLLAQAETFQRNSSRLQREHSRMSEEFATLQRIHAKCGQTVDQQVLEDHKKALDELRSFLERKLRDQVEDLKASADRAAQGREEVFRLKDRVEALKTENESLKERLRTSSAEEIDRLRRDYEERLKRAAEVRNPFTRAVSVALKRAYRSRRRRRR